MLRTAQVTLIWLASTALFFADLSSHSSGIALHFQAGLVRTSIYHNFTTYFNTVAATVDNDAHDDLLEAMLARGLDPSKIQAGTDDDDEVENLDLHRGGAFLGRGNLTCHSCDDPHCHDDLGGEGQVCHDALKCYLGQVREADGAVRRHRGCARDLAAVSFYCRVAAFDGGGGGVDAAQYSFSCCHGGHLCNGGEFPPLPAPPSAAEGEDGVEGGGSGSLDDDGLNLAHKIAIAVAVPLAVLLPCAVCIACLLQRKHKVGYE